MPKRCKPAPSHRERDENYHRVIYRLSGWRVIVCKDDLQWIIQRRTHVERLVPEKWQGKHYVTTRDALVRLWRGSTGDDGAFLVSALPERFETKQ